MHAVRISQGALLKMVASRLVVGIPVLFAILFVPAGTFRYWEAWLYLAILLIPMAFVMIYFFKNSPELLERRMRFREQETEQSRIVKLSYVFFLAAFILPGLDQRFGWSNVPTYVVLFADVIVLLGYGIVILVFRANRYASRVVEVAQDQQVISTGPYAVVRHPMYSGAILMYVFSPLALGSYWAILPALMIVPLLVARIRNEEALLARSLLGYQSYMQTTRCRLLPGIW
jgi:protein-S-isoprenylcysteine O-methyltransferase Ste14